jgi:lipoate-protein ligase A
MVVVQMKGMLIAFRIYKNTDARTVNRFCQKFYGQAVSSHGGKYHYHRKGLLEDIPHVKLIRSVIIVSTRDADKVIRFLREFNAEVHVRDVTLTHEDRKTLQVKGV